MLFGYMPDGGLLVRAFRVSRYFALVGYVLLEDLDTRDRLVTRRMDTRFPPVPSDRAGSRVTNARGMDKRFRILGPLAAIQSCNVS